VASRKQLCKLSAPLVNCGRICSAGRVHDAANRIEGPAFVYADRDTGQVTTILGRASWPSRRNPQRIQSPSSGASNMSQNPEIERPHRIGRHPCDLLRVGKYELRLCLHSTECLPPASAHVPPPPRLQTARACAGNLIAFKDGIIRPAMAHEVEGKALHYMDLDHAPKEVPLNQVDRALSQELNRLRRVPFRLPVADEGGPR
jgi:hypothetical protein